MKNAYNITDIRFENEFLLIKIDNKLVKLLLSDISVKLTNATDQERNDYTISPSGYGIHWRLLDEDLSINGLLKTAEAKRALQSTIPPAIAD
jgi:hypothetical protein